MEAFRPGAGDAEPGLLAVPVSPGFRSRPQPQTEADGNTAEREKTVPGWNNRLTEAAFAWVRRRKSARPYGKNSRPFDSPE